MDADPGSASSPVDLEAVEAASRFRHWTLAFPPGIEARFEADVGPAGARRLANGMIWIILTYNAFLVADALLLPDIFALSLVLHLLVVTPVFGAFAFALRRRPSATSRTRCAAAILAMMVAQSYVSFGLSASPNVNHYQYLIILLLLLGNNILRPAFPHAIVLTALIAVTHVIAIFTHPQMTSPAIVTVVALLAGAVYVTLVGNRQAEIRTRRSYLRRLRDEIAAAQLSRDNLALARMARIDPLTNVENRRGLEAYVVELLASPRETSFALLVIDVDHFKAFNDRHGHAEGDRCLKAIAEAIGSELRPADAFLGRVGGEEFVALLPGADLEAGRRVGDRLRKAVEQLTPSQTAECVTVSIGVAQGRLTGRSAVAAAFDAADAALYVAKRRGRNRVQAGPAPAEPARTAA